MPQSVNGWHGEAAEEADIDDRIPTGTLYRWILWPGRAEARGKKAQHARP